MRPSIRRLVEIAARTLPLPEPVYEFGSLQVMGKPELEDLRSVFPGRVYVGCDMRDGPGVDRVLDLHAIDLPDGVAGTVLLMDTLEHVAHPHRAMAEIHRILRPDGVVLLSTVLDFPIHDYPHDYWRFTPQGIELLLEAFPTQRVGYYGRDIFPHTIAGVGFKGEAPDLTRFLAGLENWKRHGDAVLRRLTEDGVT